MAPVKIKYIVSFSCQDDCHKASNLITSDGFRRWMSHPRDRSGKIEVILQLEESCQFAYIDIGTTWCASLEVRVGRSDWPQTQEFKSLVQTVNLMTPVDCRLSRATNSTRMFGKNDFSKEVAAEKWDRLQVICRQPFRKDIQYGVSFIRIRSVNPTSTSSTEMTESHKMNSIKIGGSPQNVTKIQKHFFGKSVNKDDEDESSDMRYRLMKISGSGENGCEQEEALSRTAKLVLKASENKRLYSPQQGLTPPKQKRGLFSESVAKKHNLTVEEEMKEFLPTLNIAVSDIDRVTVAELRHKFERRKRRKLTQEEKKTFSGICQNFICDLCDKDASDLDSSKAQNSAVKVGESVKSTSVPRDVSSAKTKHEQSSRLSVTKLPNNNSCSVLLLSEKHPSPKNSFISKDKRIHNTSSAGKEPSSSTVSMKHQNFTSTGNRDASVDLSPHQKSLPVTSPLSLKRIPKGASPSVATKLRQKVGLESHNAVTGSSSVKRNVGESDNCDKDKTDEDIAISDQDSMSSVSYDDEDEDITDDADTDMSDKSDTTSTTPAKSPSPSATCQEPLKPSTRLSTPTGKVSLLENKVKSCQSSYRTEKSFNETSYLSSGGFFIPKRKLSDSQTEEFNSSNSPTSSGGQQPKRKKLNKSSLDLLQEFNSEIISDDDTDNDVEILPENLLPPLEKKLTLSSSKNTSTPSDLKSSLTCLRLTPDKKGFENPSNVTPDKSVLPFSEMMPRNKTLSAKGKIYRMYSSSSANKSRRKIETGDSVVPNRNDKSLNVSVNSPHEPRSVKTPRSLHTELLSQNRVTGVSEKSTPGNVTQKIHFPGFENLNTDTDSYAKKNSGGKGQVKEKKSSKKKNVADHKGSKSDGPVYISTPRKRKRSQGSDVVRDGQESDKGKHDGMTKSAQEMTFCDKCFAFFPSDTFSTHLPYCVPPISNNQVSDYGQGERDDLYQGELSIDETVCYAECPICMQQFPQDVLLVHASECGI